MGSKTRTSQRARLLRRHSYHKTTMGHARMCKKVHRCMNLRVKSNAILGHLRQSLSQRAVSCRHCKLLEQDAALLSEESSWSLHLSQAEQSSPRRRLLLRWQIQLTSCPDLDVYRRMETPRKSYRHPQQRRTCLSQVPHWL